MNKWILILAFAAGSVATGQSLDLGNEQEIEAQMADSALEVGELAANTREASGVNKALSQQVQGILRKGKSLAAAGQFQEASKLYFQMSKSPHFRESHSEIKYILGLMLFEMKLYQSAGFMFFDVVQREARANNHSKFLRLSLEKLSLVTNFLESDVLLKFAVSKVSAEDFPQVQRDLFYYRLGDLKLKNKDFAEAASIFSKVPNDSSFYATAKYKEGLALAESGAPDKALQAFAELREVSRGRGITDNNRVNSILGQARVHYQRKNFARATELYREIPRDTVQWHDSMFERSWSMLRSGQFRSALSNFHTLHSTYYTDFYMPESLLLRGIVYLYICRWEEMEKTLNLYDRLYRPIYKQVADYISSNDSLETHYSEIRKVSDYLQRNKSKPQRKPQTRLPFNILNRLTKSGDIKQSLVYLTRLENELGIISRLSPGWQRTGVGQYSARIVKRRISSTRDVIARLVRRDLLGIQTELRDLTEQTDFLRLEQVTGQKEIVRKQIAGKDLPTKQVDEDRERDFYIQNGYEYWPFKGEYWLDELGTYHYLGVQNCQK